MLLCSPLLAGETEAGELTWPKTSCPPCLSLPAREEPSLLGQIHPGCHRELFRDSSARSHLHLMDASSVALAGFCFVFPQRPMAVSCTQAASPGLKPCQGFHPKPQAFTPSCCRPPARPRPVHRPGDQEWRGSSLCLAGCGTAYVLRSAPCLLFIRFLRVNLCFHRCPSVSFSSSLLSTPSVLAGAAGARGPHPQQLRVTLGSDRHFASLHRSCIPAGRFLRGSRCGGIQG